MNNPANAKPTGMMYFDTSSAPTLWEKFSSVFVGSTFVDGHEDQDTTTPLPKLPRVVTTAMNQGSHSLILWQCDSVHNGAHKPSSYLFISDEFRPTSITKGGCPVRLTVTHSARVMEGMNVYMSVHARVCAYMRASVHKCVCATI